ncbi:MAG TPA: NAD-dependent epimerase/dehydratase family protein [Thermoanaerobaculia bacterium]|nr:NAD-dependent epimerase/dehydratase family protein [Thermoanaerobaculia bacterium]
MALVTGASGFLGRHLVMALLAQDRSVVALCRKPEALADLRHPHLRIAAGDFRDPASYTELLTSGASVFHLAAMRNQPQVRAREMEEVNVEATLNLARRSGDRGIARFVHVATALIFGPARDGRARTEQDDLDPTGSAYVRSKIAAVRGARDLAREGLPVVTVCPTIVFGPDHPSHPNRVSSEIRRLLKGWPGIWLAGGRQSRNLVFVEDVVRGMLAAEERGTKGEEYLLGGDEIAPRELTRQVLALAGRRNARALSLPAGAARAAAWILDRLRGQDRRTAGAGYAAAVETLLLEWRFSSAKARRDLGYQPLSVAEGLVRTLDGLQLLKGSRGDDRG